MDIPALGVRMVPLFQNNDGTVSGYPRWLQDWGFGSELLSSEKIVSPAQDFPRSVINISLVVGQNIPSLSGQTIY